jgi:hypothetical protein
VPAILFKVANAEYSPLDPANIPRLGLQQTTALASGGPATIHAHLCTQTLYEKLHKLVN